MTGRPGYGRRGGASRAGGRPRVPDDAAVAAGLVAARADRLARLAGTAAGPLGWVEGRLLREIVQYIRGTDKVDGLDQRLQRQYPGVPGMRMLCHHETDSRRTAAGWPDLFIAGPGGQIVVELKTVARRNRVSAEQSLWLDVLALNGAAAYLWTPADWVAGAIQNELQRLARPLRRAQPREA